MPAPFVSAPFLSWDTANIALVDFFLTSALRFLPVAPPDLYTGKNVCPRLGTALLRICRNPLIRDSGMVPLGGAAINLSGLPATHRSSYSPMSLDGDAAFAGEDLVLLHI